MRREVVARELSGPERRATALRVTPGDQRQALLRADGREAETRGVAGQCAGGVQDRETARDTEDVALQVGTAHSCRGIVGRHDGVPVLQHVVERTGRLIHVRLGGADAGVHRADEGLRPHARLATLIEADRAVRPRHHALDRLAIGYGDEPARGDDRACFAGGGVGDPVEGSALEPGLGGDILRGSEQVTGLLARKCLLDVGIEAHVAGVGLGGHIDGGRRLRGHRPAERERDQG
jgi:hypothetical protein